MAQELKFLDNKKYVMNSIKIAIIVLLLVMEVLVIAQYVSLFLENNALAQFIAVVLCCCALAVLEAIDSFAINNFAGKMVFYGLETTLLLVLCVLTSNSYLSILYCIILTQSYISVDNLKKNIILFGVGCGLYTISFIVGWVVVNEWVSLYKSIVQVLGDAVLGIAVLAVHCAVTNFILKFYNNNLQLRRALKEADASRAELKEVYEQLSSTAVFEERNRIAKDIHDNAGHSMTTVIMQTEAAKLLIDTNPEEAKNRIISANMQAKNALEQMRESVHLLAGRTQTRSLKEQIEEIIAQTIDGTELKVRCDLQDVTVGEGELRFLCNTVKEGLANGIRHGKATAFYIELKVVEERAELLISDNGCGIDGELNEGFGLKGIRRNAKVFGGECSFSGEKDEGFELRLSLPLTQNTNIEEREGNND